MIKKICDAGLSIFTLLFLAAALLLLVPELFGIRPMVVQSGSMEPSYPVGSVVYVKNCGADEVEEGDAISFYLSENTVVTHRVVEKDEENRCFYTKGDANDRVDEKPVTYEALIGRAVGVVPLLGYAVAGLWSSAGKGIGLAAVALLLAGLLLRLTNESGKDKKETEHSR